MQDIFNDFLNKVASDMELKITAAMETEIDKVRKMVKKELESRPIYNISLISEKELKQKTFKTQVSSYLKDTLQLSEMGFNVLLIGPAGCGKTTIASQVADALGLPFGNLTLTQGASETWLFGRQTPTGFIEGQFSKFYREGGVFLLDELDAADANLLLAINTAIAGESLYNPILGEQFHRHPNFKLIAAANTNGLGASEVYTGRSRLDAATLDRFVCLNIDYDATIEKVLLGEYAAEVLPAIQKFREHTKSLGSTSILSTRMVARIPALLAAYTKNQMVDILFNKFDQAEQKKIKELISDIKRKL